MRLLKNWLALGALVLLGACGGGGGDAGEPILGGGGDGGSEAVADDLSLVLSASTVENNGTTTVTATVTAVDVNRNALPDIPVTLSVDSDAVATVSGTQTDAQGLVTAEVGIGVNRSSRVITVKAVSGDITRTASFTVQGASLAGTPLPAVIQPGEQGEVEFRLLDANANPMSDMDIVITSPGGVQTTGTTGANGEYLFTYTAPTTPGLFEIQAVAGGDDVSITVTVDAGVGAIPPATEVVTTASVSANPSVVAVNSGNTNNRSEIRALFLGDGNVAVENVRVRFDLAGDPHNVGGSFISGSSIVYSNSSGTATSAYVPGERSSPADGVTIRACWDYDDFGAGQCPNAVTTNLTIVSEALSVSIGTDATIQVGDTGLDYVKRYVVQVVDAAGQAKADVQVSAAIDLLRYFKGEWTVGAVWEQQLMANCDNEDLDRNGASEVWGTEDGEREDANESLNLTNGRPALEPRKADASVSFEGSSRTNSSGQVVVRVTYPQSVASWVEFNLVVSASGISGTEGRANYQGILLVLADEVEDIDTDVPFRLSPYGVETSPTIFTQNPQGLSGMLCTNPN